MCFTSKIVPLATVLTLLTLVLFPALTNAQEGTFFVEGSNVGIGVATPSKPLHIQSFGVALGNVVQIDADIPARITFNNINAPSQWSFGHENNDRFVVNRAGSGIQEFSVAPNGDIFVGGSVVHSSSRTRKEALEAVDPEKVLTALVEIPITEWSYKSDDVRHIGPMAEDFYETFGVGSDARHIALNDSAGVALAAIQGLYRQLQGRNTQIEELVTLVKQKNNRIEDLEKRLAALEAAAETGSR